ncbi:T9SS type A sorting domain-containing protein [Aequorivita todarodis]|nr:T9SS type A sorting domain-containing protein [Aequorivita todarodis]MDC8001487.1 T9SS type A sorting domain-containing protein [Aequorivita todarodis]
MAKFSASGVLDTSYANNGYLSFDFFGLGNYDEALNLVLQQDGKLLVIGGADNDIFRVEFGALRLNQNGSLDNTFGENGIFHCAIGPADAYPLSVQLQVDGKAVLAGSTEGESTLSFAIARIITDSNVGILDLESNQMEALIYPNPVIDKAILNYELQNSANVSIELLAVDGKSIEKIMNNTIINPGKNQIEVNLSNVASGIYLLKLTADNAVKTVKLIKP